MSLTYKRCIRPEISNLEHKSSSYTIRNNIPNTRVGTKITALFSEAPNKFALSTIYRQLEPSVTYFFHHPRTYENFLSKIIHFHF